MRYIIGIDPGQEGGIAILDTKAMTLHAFRMPVAKTTKTKKSRITKETTTKTKIELDRKGIRESLDFPRQDIIMVIIEKVSTRPLQGIASNGKLMWGHGYLIGVIETNKYPYQEPVPQVWKKKFNLTANKELSRERATELFPNCAYYWRTKNRDGLAEAALMTLYGLNILNISIDTTKIQPYDSTKSRTILMENHI